MSTSIARRATLVANTVSFVTIEGDFAEIEVTNRSGSAEVFYRLGLTEAATLDPTTTDVRGDTFLLPAAITSRRHVVRGREPRTVVKLISAGTPSIEVQGLDPQVTL